MENSKVKFEEIVKEVAPEALFEALGTARPMYKGLSDKDLSLVLGLSEFQYDHLNEALIRTLSEKIVANMLKHLESGNSIEVPKAFNLFIHESEVKKNESGERAKKVSVRTRRALKEKLN